MLYQLIHVMRVIDFDYSLVRVSAGIRKKAVSLRQPSQNLTYACLPMRNEYGIFILSDHIINKAFL
jgi:hypothetical protein